MTKSRGFLLGFYSLLSQVILVREVLNILSGNEISIVAFFSIWLGGIFLGALLQNFINVREKSVKFLTISNPLILFLLTLVSLFLIRWIRIPLHLSHGEVVPVGYFFFVSLSVFPLSFFIGFSFPLILRYEKGGLSPASLYFWESVGSIFSLIFFTFFLAGRANPVSIVFLMGIFSFLFLFKNKFVSVLVFLSILFSFFIWGSYLTKFFENLRWRSYQNGFKLVVSKDSKYQNISIGKLNEEYGIFLNGDLFTIFPDPYTKKIRDYFFLLQNFPKKVLVVGGGYEEDLKYFLRFKGIKKLYYVELDPDYINVLKPFTGEIKDERLKIFFEDGRKFLKENREKFDLIVLNVPQPANLNENRFYTKEFCEILKNSLTENGFLATHLPGKENYMGREVKGFISSYYFTLKKSFKNVIAIPGDEILFLAGSGNFILDLKELVKRYDEINLDKNFSPYSLSLILQRERIDWLNNILNGSGGELNDDYHPELFFKFLRVLSLKYGGKITKGIGDEELRLLLYTFISVLVLIIFYLYVLLFLFKLDLRVKKYASFLSMFLGGFGGMSILYIYIYLFQIFYGYVYSYIGLLFAIFMTGLTCGSFIFQKWILNSWKKCLLLSLIPLIVFLSTYIFTYFNLTDISIFIIFFSIFLGGFSTGGLFATSSETLEKTGIEREKSGAIIDSLDHLGGISSTIFIGFLSMNFFGVGKTLLLLFFIFLIFSIFSILLNFTEIKS